MNETNIAIGPDSWIAAAVAQKVDTDQLRELLAIKREHDADIARRAFAEAMSEAQAALPMVVKDRANLQTSSRYATMDAIVSACMPIVTGHGFSVSYGTDKTELPGCVGITMTVRHRAGHAESVRCDIPLDLTGIAGKTNKTALHAHGSTMTYGQRYLFKLFFNLATGDDTDGNQPDATITEEQAANIEALISESGANRELFLKHIKADAIESLPASKYQQAVRALEAKRRRAT